MMPFATCDPLHSCRKIRAGLKIKVFSRNADMNHEPLRLWLSVYESAAEKANNMDVEANATALVECGRDVSPLDTFARQCEGIGRSFA